MCTAISYKTSDHYFGRNLDLEYHYDETVVITPRKYPLNFRCMKPIVEHYAFIGMATVDKGYPLYYDATNEYGLSMAGLNFPYWAVYQPEQESKDNIAPFEVIPWILCQCKTVAEGRKLLENINIANIPYGEKYPITPLHWILADKKECIVIEPTKQGIEILDNPIGVLTNSPNFTYHIHNLNNYLNLTNEWAKNRFSNNISLQVYSAGMGAIGLPGDWSSPSRFIRACFVKSNSVSHNDEQGSINQFFHILKSVSMPEGCVKVNNAYEKTVYTSCCNTDKGIYYYTTYENAQISAVAMHAVSLDASDLYFYPLNNRQEIHCINLCNV